MQIQTELKPMFSYSIIPIFFLILFLVIVIVLNRFMKRKRIENHIIVPNHNDLMEIQKKYLSLIDQLENNFTNNKISNRKAYQELSVIIRNFVFETTHIKVQNYTLKEIKIINMPFLHDLIREYYDPEFSSVSKGNILASINKTRMVIVKWN